MASHTLCADCIHAGASVIDGSSAFLGRVVCPMSSTHIQRYPADSCAYRDVDIVRRRDEYLRSIAVLGKLLELRALRGGD